MNTKPIKMLLLGLACLCLIFSLTLIAAQPKTSYQKTNKAVHAIREISTDSAYKEFTQTLEKIKAQKNTIFLRKVSSK